MISRCGKLLVLVSGCLLLMGGLCEKTAGTNFTVTNESGATIRSFEVNYPGGSFGAAAIQPGNSFQKWVPASGSCRLKVRFVDATNRERITDIDLGQHCPPGALMVIAADNSVTARPLER